MPSDDGTVTAHTIEISVCCLACGLPYKKPLSGTVASANPGCPACGYLGWARDPDAPPPGSERTDPVEADGSER